MSDDYRGIELITGTARRRHWATEQKLQIIEESLLPGETVSSVARRRGVDCASKLFLSERLGELRQLEARVPRLVIAACQ